MNREVRIMMSSRGKLLLGMTLGALLLGGGIFGYVHAQTQAQQSNRLVCASARPGAPLREVGPAEAAERIADAFGVNKAEVQKAIEAKRDFRDIGRAAMLAKVSGKSFAEVLELKKKDNTWRDVERGLGVKHEQMQGAFCELEARHLSEQSIVDQETALQLIKNGYEGHDIRAAAVLARASGKDIQSVLDLKKINNHWYDVAKELGVDAHGLHLDGGYGSAVQDDDFDGCNGPTDCPEFGDASTVTE